MKPPLILAIDTSCDETCTAITCGNRIISNVIDSQINIHAKYGGVVPHLAKRAHEAKIGFVVDEALRRSDLVGKRQSPTFFAKPDAVAVTVGPGLAPALEVGIAYAKKLAAKWHKPLIAVNHMEGHLLSALAEPGFRAGRAERCAQDAASAPGASEYVARLLAERKPVLGLLASGGHTQLVLVKKLGSYQLLGETLDDACGEALDKLAKMLQLGYPGGPIVEILAKKGNPNLIKLPVPLQHSQDLNFSFSGLKTAAMYLIKNQPKISKTFTVNLCASFQQAIAISLCTKLKKAIKQYQPQAILLGGGVFSNLYLRRQVRAAAQPLPLFLPYSQRLYTDNAAMIGIAAQFNQPSDKLDRQPNLNIKKDLNQIVSD